MAATTTTTTTHASFVTKFDATSIPIIRLQAPEGEKSAPVSSPRKKRAVCCCSVPCKNVHYIPPAWTAQRKKRDVWCCNVPSKSPIWLLGDSDTAADNFVGAHFAKTLWLFIQSDIKTFIIPCLAFGLPLFLSSPNLGAQLVSIRLAQALLWTLSILIVLNIQNQLPQDSIAEDKINKPHRPIASGRITPEQAEKMLAGFFVLALAISYTLNVLPQGILLLILFHLYCARGWSESPVSRTMTNVIGLMCSYHGTTEVLLGGAMAWRSKTGQWLFVIGSVILCTIHIQDIPDIPGDQTRSRRTVPLVLGERYTRYFVAFFVVAWSVACPWFWNARAAGWMISIWLALFVAGRLLFLRTVKDDKATFRLYLAWLVGLYVLPLLV